jgi:hypothetical protein
MKKMAKAGKPKSVKDDKIWRQKIYLLSSFNNNKKSWRDGRSP